MKVKFAINKVIKIQNILRFKGHRHEIRIVRLE
jgi:hypothetical protein